MTFCPMCDNELVEDGEAFGYCGQVVPRRDECDAVLCARHEAEAEAFAVEADLHFGEAP